ncbi:conidiation protein 6 [Podospora didyma]|uniref:Conidiation protein 6 n=1 Tax=Podospora didyma TaxID=330526 RepID=A0AAE0KJJ2_9PEZI|nr:conidiation protein 6 [Podospora didyma]
MPTEAQIAGGHKANINNPNTSQGSKQNSQKILDNEFNGGDVPKASDNQEGKNPGNVAGGLKAQVFTLKNPNVSDEAKESAKERLNQM